MTTIAEIFARFPPGDERLKALEEWRKAQFNEGPAQAPSPLPPLPKDPLPAPSSRPVGRPRGPDYEARREWEARREEAERQREAEQAAAIRARVTKAAELTAHRINALPDMSTRKEKMRRLAELQASITANRDPKTLAIISRSFSEIEARLARLTAE